VVGYRRAGGQIRLEHYAQQLHADLSHADAATALANLLEAQGARGRPAAVAVTGFGTYHQMLTLPPAPREILHPIVGRELRRFYPDLFATEGVEPLIEFVETGVAATTPASGPPHRELLVAAAPRVFVESVHRALGARGIPLVHWTIAPRAVQCLFDAFAEPEGNAAALVMVPRWPLLGFFHDGLLRLFAEPQGSATLGPRDEVEGVMEHLERGALFLRQQFRGAMVRTALVAAEPGAETTALADQLTQRLGVFQAPLGPFAAAPGALAALGPALDAEREDALNLLPSELRPRSAADRWTRALGVGSALVLLLAAGWWAWSAQRAERRAEQQLQAITRQVEAQAPALAEVQPIVRERQAHAQRVAALELLTRTQRRLPEVLWPLQAAAPAVRVEELQLTPEEQGWRVTLTGSAAAPTSAQATDAVVALQQQLAAELPDGAIQLGNFSYSTTQADSAGAAQPLLSTIAVNFQMSFIVPAVEGNGE
jgi:hypothetical protein